MIDFIFELKKNEGEEVVRKERKGDMVVRWQGRSDRSNREHRSYQVRR